ncbi:MAG: DUF4398 domain-containing protein, partial [Pseudomonadota bacterium]
MSKKTILFVILGVVIIFLIFILVRGCDKPPTEELSQAEKAIAEAKQKEADLYAQDIFKKAEEAFRKAKEFMGGKKYEDAKKAALETVTLARQAITEGEQNRAKLKAEAEQMLSEVEKSLHRLKNLLEKSLKTRGPRETKEMQGMIAQWEKNIATIREMIRGGKIHGALEQLKT